MEDKDLAQDKEKTENDTDTAEAQNFDESIKLILQAEQALKGDEKTNIQKKTGKFSPPPPPSCKMPFFSAAAYKKALALLLRMLISF